MTTIKCYRIPGHEYAKAKIVIAKRTVKDESYVTAVRLVSYNTDVMGIELKDGGIYELYVNGLYSMTTRKHISWFCRIAPGPLTYQEIKKCFEEWHLRLDGTRDASLAEMLQILNIVSTVENTGKQLR